MIGVLLWCGGCTGTVGSGIDDGPAPDAQARIDPGTFRDAPVVNEADQLTYYIGIQKDVTDEVEALERVRQLEAQVAELQAELARCKG